MVGMYYDPKAQSLPESYWKEVAAAGEGRQGKSKADTEKGLDIIKQAERAIAELDQQKTGNLLKDATIIAKQDRLRGIIEQAKTDHNLGGVASNPDEASQAIEAKKAFVDRNLESKMAEERSNRIDQYVARKRAELEASGAVVPRGTEPGAPLRSAEDTKRMTVKDEPLAPNPAVVGEEISGLNKDLEAMLKENPERLAAFKEAIEKGLPKDVNPAIQAAAECLIESGL